MIESKPMRFAIATSFSSAAASTLW